MAFGFGFGFPRRVGGVGWSPSALFSSGEAGAWYDPSDLTTLFQDSAGTTPVTAVEQPVGLMLDKSKGLVLGSELVTNGGFATDTDWTKVSATIADGQATLQANGSVSQAVLPVETGRWFQITLTVVSTAGAVIVYCGTTSSGDTRYAAAFSTTGTRTLYLQSAGINNSIRFASTSAGVSVVDNISVRELPGNHAFNTNATTVRPVLSARYNLFERTEEFENGVWARANQGAGNLPVVTANAGTDPLGGNTADRIQFSRTGTTAVDRSRIQQAASVAANKVYQFSVWLKSFDGSTQTVSIFPNWGDGVVLVATVTNEWQRFTVSANTLAGTVATALFGLGYTVNSVTSADVLAWGAQLIPIDDLLSNAYQRVVTATDYDATPGTFPYYLAFDGATSNRWLQTANIDFSTGPSNPPLGPDLVANGAFNDGAANWTLDPIVTVSAGVAVFDGVTSVPTTLILLRQSTLLATAGKWYRITYTITAPTTNPISFYFAGVNGTARSAAGTYTEIIRAPLGGASYPFDILTRSLTGVRTGGVDNIIVQELDSAYAPDKMSVFAGVRKVSDANFGIIAELSANVGASNGIFNLYGNNSASYVSQSKGTTAVSATTELIYAAPITNVLTALGDISGDIATLRVNSAVAATNTGDQGTGTYGNHPLYIGRRGGTTLPYNGRLYSLIVRGALTDAGTIALAEDYVETKTFGKNMNIVFIDPLTAADLTTPITTADGDPLYVTTSYE